MRYKSWCIECGTFLRTIPSTGEIVTTCSKCKKEAKAKAKAARKREMKKAMRKYVKSTYKNQPVILTAMLNFIDEI